MATQYLEQTTSRNISAAANGVLSFRLPFAGIIKAVTVYVNSTVASTNTFDVNLNGSTLFPTQSNRPSIGSGASSASNGGSLSTAGAAGDRITVDADVVGESLLGLTLILTIDDKIEKGVGILSRPTTSNAEDEEFEGLSLDSKWTKTNSATVESYNDKIKSALWTYMNAGSSSISLEQSYSNAGDFSATLCFSCPLLSNYNGVYFTIQDSSGNNLVQMQYLSNTGLKIRTNKRISGTYTFDINTATIVNINYPIAFLHIQRSTNNWLCYYSNDGLVWTLLSTIAVTMTVAKFTINVAPADATSKCVTALHWFRRDWLTL